MHLPNEILERALQDLPKADLKAARLVNSRWSSCAARFLFDTVYISPHKTNIDVFQSVTQHPVLRHCVKRVCYDLVEFNANWTYAQYFWRLWRDMTWWTEDLEEPFDCPDAQINSFLKSARWKSTKTPELRLRMAMEKCGDFDPIKAGYRKWLEHALYQQKCTENDNFARILVVGLQRLNHLSTLSMNDGWPLFGNPRSHVGAPAYLSGSPLARSWGIFDARPLNSAFSFGIGGSCLLSNFAFWNMTVALPKSVKRICNCEHKDGVSLAVVDTQNIATEPRLLPGIYAFARLKELKLIIAYDHNDMAEYHSLEALRYYSLRGLRHMLHWVQNLEALDLGFRRYDELCRDEWFTYESVFPRDGIWPHLRRFVVRNLEITDKDLICLLFGRMFCLQHLVIGDMRLLHGTWEWVIETLKFRGLSSFEISSYHLGYDDDKNFLEPLMSTKDEDNACPDFIASIEKYVVHGWHDLTLRHPSLKKDEPTQDSLNYLESDVVVFMGLSIQYMEICVSDTHHGKSPPFRIHENEYVTTMYIFGQLPGIKGTGETVRVGAAVLKTVVAEVCAEANRRRDMAVVAGLPEAGTELKPNLNSH